VWSVHVKRLFVWLIVAAFLVIGFVFYLSRSGSKLKVDPHARDVIEKAKRR
jgi:Tfp pilus assembly protein PilO